MSLADGLAAIVGVKFGASQAYRVFGARKSLAGSTTFFIVSLVLLIGFSINQHQDFSPLLVVIALGATVLENIAVRGLDNIVIPAFLAWVLSRLQ
jgi:phytol kinase